MAEEEFIPRRLRRFKRREEEARKQEEAKKARPYAVVEKPKEAGEKKPSFLGGLFGQKKKPVDVAEAPAPEARAKAVERRKKEIEKIKAELAKEVKSETVEAMAEEIYGQVERKPGKPRSERKKAEAKQMTLKELREFRRKHKRLPTKEEYSSIADSVISQLKTGMPVEEETDEALEEARPSPKEAEPEKKMTARERIAAMRAKRQAGKKGQAEKGKGKAEGVLPPEAPPKRPTVEDRAAQEKRIKELLGEEEEIKALGEEEGVEEIGALPEEEEEEVPVIEEEKNKCSNCGSLTTRKIYCPDCGTEFCDNCAAARKDEGGHFKYKCPACGKEFKKKKC